MIKKFLTVMLCALLTIGVAVSCGENAPVDDNNQQEQPENPDPDPEDPDPVPVAVNVGANVYYNVAYTDVVNNTSYTAENGWRLITATPNEDGTYSGVEYYSKSKKCELDLTKSENEFALEELTGLRIDEIKELQIGYQGYKYGRIR